MGNFGVLSIHRPNSELGWPGSTPGTATWMPHIYTHMYTHMYFQPFSWLSSSGCSRRAPSCSVVLCPRVAVIRGMNRGLV